MIVRAPIDIIQIIPKKRTLEYMQLLDRLLITLQSGIYSFSVDNDPSYILLIKGLLHFPKGEMPT